MGYEHTGITKLADHFKVAPRPAGELLEMIQSLRVSAPSNSSTVTTVELMDNYNVYKVFRNVNTQFLSFRNANPPKKECNPPQKRTS
jgi:hypothetical protein